MRKLEKAQMNSEGMRNVQSFEKLCSVGKKIIKKNARKQRNNSNSLSYAKVCLCIYLFLNFLLGNLNLQQRALD